MINDDTDPGWPLDLLNVYLNIKVCINSQANLGKTYKPVIYFLNQPQIHLQTFVKSDGHQHTDVTS